MMKRLAFMGMCAVMLFSLSACGGTGGQSQTDKGTAEKTEQIEATMKMVTTTQAAADEDGELAVKQVPSEIYSQEDIDAAIDVIVKEFNANWTGCTLKEIYYAGDEMVKENESRAADYDADQVIVLLSTFDVGADYQGSLEPGSTYKDWNWILVRKAGGEWQHVDHGY